MKYRTSIKTQSVVYCVATLQVSVPKPHVQYLLYYFNYTRLFGVQCFSDWVPRKGVRGLRETKMRNDGRVLLAAQNLYVRV